MDNHDEENEVDQNKFQAMLQNEKQSIENDLNKLENARRDNEQNKNDPMETDMVIENLNVKIEIPKNLNEGHKTPPVPTMGTSLGLIASYGSSTDDDNSDEDENKHKCLPVKMDQSIDYRANDSSSDEETDSSSSSSDDESSSSESDSSTDDLEVVEIEFEKTNNNKSSEYPLRVRGEQFIDELPPIEDLKISVPETECIEIGKVQSIVAQLLLVESYPGTAALDLDTVLFLENGARPLGKIFDVIGQITAPLYCVRFNSRQHIDQLGITIGMKVYCAPRSEHTSYVILSNIMNTRGSDASWENDIEADPIHQDYSDDEEERAARRARKKRSNTIDAADSSSQQKTNNEPRSSNNGGRSSTRFRGDSRNNTRISNTQHFSSQFSHNNNSWHNNIPPSANMPGPSYPNPYAFSPEQRYRMINFQRPPPPPPIASSYHNGPPQFNQIPPFLPNLQFPAGPRFIPRAQYPTSSHHSIRANHPPTPNNISVPGFPQRLPFSGQQSGNEPICPPGMQNP